LHDNKGKGLLQSALSHFPQVIVQKAYEARWADQDSVVHRVAQIASEIESLEWHRLFLYAIWQHEENQLAVKESLLETVKNILSPCSLHELEDDSGYYCATFAKELVALTVTDTQLDCIGSDTGLVRKDDLIAA